MAHGEAGWGEISSVPGLQCPFPPSWDDGCTVWLTSLFPVWSFAPHWWSNTRARSQHHTQRYRGHGSYGTPISTLKCLLSPPFSYSASLEHSDWGIVIKQFVSICFYMPDWKKKGTNNRNQFTWCQCLIWQSSCWKQYKDFNAGISLGG